MCSFAHTNGFSYSDARVKVVKEESRGLSEPHICRHCPDAPCIEACPEEAISHEKHGWVLLDEELCVGGGLCVEACPYDALYLDREKGFALKCDLCGGDPQCVKVCRFPRALVWELQEAAAQEPAIDDQTVGLSRPKP